MLLTAKLPKVCAESASTADDGMEMFEHICPKAGWCPRNVLDTVIELAIEIAREGREGRRIGTLFTLGFADSVLRNSRALILDPIAAHPREARHITDPNVRGTIKELAQLDGAFVLDEDGTIQAACRYLDTSSKEINMTFGLGSRHLAGASISRETNAIAIVVSESAVVRIFYEGCLQAEILPELWLLSRHSLHLRGPVHQDSLQDVAIFTAEEAVAKAEQSTEVLLSLPKVTHKWNGHVAEFGGGACNATVGGPGTSASKAAKE